MINPEVQWTTPAPFWTALPSSAATAGRAADAGHIDDTIRASFRQPAILRFASDTFMNEFMALLDSDPARLTGYYVQPETWRGPATAAIVDQDAEKLPAFAKQLNRSRLASLRAVDPPKLPVSTRSAQALAVASTGEKTALPLKLYQPAHQRYYLITACLVCRVPGQPDRHIETGNQERVSYVIRRVVPRASIAVDQWPQEYAFVAGPTGFSWQLVDDRYCLASGEDQNPLFGVNFTQDDGHRRRLLAGVIPVGKREVYTGAPQRDAVSGALVLDEGAPQPPDPRQVLLRSQVTEPWKAAIERAAATIKTLNTPLVPTPTGDDTNKAADAKSEQIKAAREQIQTTSWYVLLDFAKFLAQYLNPVWQVVIGPNAESTSLDDDDQDAVLTALKKTTLQDGLVTKLVDSSKNFYTASDVKRTLLAALQAVAPQAVIDQLESVMQSYDRTQIVPKSQADPSPTWPHWLFPLADPEAPESAPQPPEGVAALKDGVWDRDSASTQIDRFVDLITAALGESSEPVPPLPLAAQPVMNIDSRAWFIIRCIFERPNCGGLCPSVVSAATEPFQMAGFFDPDAPARPIRIALPIDISPAGLRKFDKNTAFMISDMLCGQIERVKSLGLGDLIRSVLPWPLHKDLDVPDGGPCTDDKDPSISLGMICSLSIPIITICALLLLMVIVNLLDIIFKWVPYFILCFPLPKFKGKSTG